MPLMTSLRTHILEHDLFFTQGAFILANIFFAEAGECIVPLVMGLASLMIYFCPNVIYPLFPICRTVVDKITQPNL